MATQKGKYKIPKNLCQSCFEASGRYIMDCYCIICQQCYARFPTRGSVCNLCGRQTKGNKIDAKQESSIKKIGHLFESLDIGMQRILEVYKFQNQIANRYCQFLEKELAAYQSAVGEIISHNPSLYSFFNSKVKLKKNIQTQPYENRSISIRPDPTIKNNKEYASQIYQSRRSTLDMNPRQLPHGAEISGIRPIGRAVNHNVNHSGNMIYKVPNINYSTAVRSSKRMNKGYQKSGPEHDEEQYLYLNPNRRY